MPAKVSLERLDAVIRTGARTMLKLPDASSNHFLYTARWDESLGLCELATAIPQNVIRRNQRLLTFKHEAVARVARVVNHVVRNLEIVSQYDLLPIGPEDSPYAPDIRGRHAKAWADQAVQGACAAAFRPDPIGNSWLSRPVLFGNPKDALQRFSDL